MILESQARGEALILLLLLLPDSEDPAPEEVAAELIIPDPPNEGTVVLSLRASMSMVAVVVAAAMISERGMIRDVRRRDMLMGCMGNWMGSTSDDSNGGILCVCV
jgi:CO/xanthine dehydrogenase FAD-binding subunit